QFAKAAVLLAPVLSRKSSIKSSVGFARRAEAFKYVSA
ncbi:MAG: hypothetical protein ACI88U_001830, partial [Porticoccaceae bacterium]